MRFPNLLRIAILPLRHLIEVSYDEEGNISFVGGVEANFIQVLSEAVGFNYQLKVPADGEWGRLEEDGNWTGVIGLVHRNEADIAIAHLTITPPRHDQLDFLTYAVEENSFATKLPHFVPRTSFFFLPFQTYVWIFVISISIVMPFLFRKIMSGNNSFQELFLGMFGSILSQQYSVATKGLRDKLLLGVWFVFAFFISSSYRTVLLSSMAVPQFDDEVRNIQELASAITAGKYTASTSKGSVDKELLTESLDESLRIIGKYITEESWLAGGNIVAAPSDIDDFEAVLGPRFFFLLEYGEAPYTTKRIFKETISFWNVGVAVRKQFCCKVQLTKRIARILNTGIYKKFYEEELFKARFNFNSKDLQKSKVRALTLTDLMGVFALLGVGFGIAIVSFTWESHSFFMIAMGGVNSFRRNSMKCGEAYYHISLTSSKKSYTSIYNYLTHTGKKINEDQPFYVFNLADILWKAQLWNERFPNVVPYYAVKANADRVLIRLFVLLGYGFDCSTEGEIRLVKEAGADPQKIIFAHTIKTRTALKYASTIGVDLMTFDSKEELQKIKEEFSKARLILRLKSASVQTVYNLSKKFGCELSEAEDLLLRAKELDLNVVGVSFHVGALCEDPKTYTSTIENSRQVFDIAERLGYKFTIMDIGAGFFGSPEREEYFYKLSEEINISLEENFPNGDVKFIAEPGCYCVASAVYFITRIIGKKSVTLNDKKEERREYYLNDGYYGSFFEHKEIYDVKPIPVLTTSESEKRPRYKTKLWGQTCCSEDIILEECFLPDLEEGELILWVNLGAYGKGVASNFTIVPFPANKYVFIQNSRLELDSIPNQQEVAEYISKEADLIQDSEEMNFRSMNPVNLKDLLKTQ